jgi:hypothetical protein
VSEGHIIVIDVGKFETATRKILIFEVIINKEVGTYELKPQKSCLLRQSSGG